MTIYKHTVILVGLHVKNPAKCVGLVLNRHYYHLIDMLLVLAMIYNVAEKCSQLLLAQSFVVQELWDSLNLRQSFIGWFLVFLGEGNVLEIYFSETIAPFKGVPYTTGR